MSVSRRMALVSVVCALALLCAPGATAATKRCGSVSVKFTGSTKSRYPVRVVKGRVTCARARAVLRGFMTSGRPPKRWICALGHGGDAWAATCATISQKTVRAYKPSG